MSIAAMSWSLKQTTGSASRKAVLVILADRAGFDWTCWPCQATIAREAELSERHVRRILVELEEGGFIRREHRYRDGARTSDLITLLGAESGTGHTRPVPDAQVRKPEPTTGHMTQPYRTPVSAEPPEEPQEPARVLLLAPLEQEPELVSSATKSPTTRRPRNPLWDAMSAEMGEPTTRTECSIRGKAVKELEQAGVSPEDIYSRIREYRIRFSGMSLTETALMKHWTALGRARPTAVSSGMQALMELVADGP